MATPTYAVLPAGADGPARTDGVGAQTTGSRRALARRAIVMLALVLYPMSICWHGRVSRAVHSMIEVARVSATAVEHLPPRRCRGAAGHRGGTALALMEALETMARLLFWLQTLPRASSMPGFRWVTICGRTAVGNIAGFVFLLLLLERISRRGARSFVSHRKRLRNVYHCVVYACGAVLFCVLR